MVKVYATITIDAGAALRKINELEKQATIPPKLMQEKMLTSVNDGKKAAKIKELLDGVKVKKDKVMNTTWYIPKGMSLSGWQLKTRYVDIYPMIKVDNGAKTVSLFYKATYTDSAGWINFHSAAIRADDNLYIVKFDINNKQRSTWVQSFGLLGSVVVCEENINKLMTQDDFAAARAIAEVKNPEELLLRLYGNSSQTDKNLSKKTIEAHKKMLALWDALKS